MKKIEKLVKAIGAFLIIGFLRGLFIIRSRAAFEKKIYEEIRKRNGKKN